MERQRETECVYETLSNLRKLAHKAEQKHDFVNELWNRLAKLSGHEAVGSDTEGEEDEPDEKSPEEVVHRAEVMTGCGWY